MMLSGQHNIVVAAATFVKILPAEVQVVQACIYGGSPFTLCMRLDLPYADEQEAVAFAGDMQRALHTVCLVLMSVRGPCCARRV